MTSVDFSDTWRLIWSHFRSFGVISVMRGQNQLYFKHATLSVLFLCGFSDTVHRRTLFHELWTQYEIGAFCDSPNIPPEMLIFFSQTNGPATILQLCHDHTGAIHKERTPTGFWEKFVLTCLSGHFSAIQAQREVVKIQIFPTGLEVHLEDMF